MRTLQGLSCWISAQIGLAAFMAIVFTATSAHAQQLNMTGPNGAPDPSQLMNSMGLNPAAYSPSGSEWGCGVLLCLAARGGAPSECSPYLTRLWYILTKTPPDPFPTCAMAGAGNYAKQVREYYPLCHEGLQETTGWVATPSESQNAWLAVNTRERTEMVRRGYQQDAWLAIGEYQVAGERGYETRHGPKACGAGYIGTYDVPRICNFYGGDAGGNNCRGGYTVRVFQRVEPLKPMNPRAINVYINGQIYNRVHW